MGSDVTFGTIKKLSRKKKSKMGTEIMSLNGVCICRRLCCVIPEVLKKNKMKMKISSHILLLHFERKKEKPSCVQHAYSGLNVYSFSNCIINVSFTTYYMKNKPNHFFFFPKKKKKKKKKKK